MNFYRKITKTSKFYFVLGIILDHFMNPKSIFRYRKLKILRHFTKQVFDLKIDFLIKKFDFSIKKETVKNMEKHKQTRKNSKIGRKRKFTEDSY